MAEELGISAMTVSNAYNRPEQLSEGLRGRIFEAAERLGYAGPDPVARSLRRQRTNLVGVLYSNRLTYAFDDAAQVLFLKGVAAATEDAGMGLLLVPGTVGSSDEERASAVMDAAVDGFVVYSVSDDNPLVGAALRRRLPVVIADQPDLDGVPSVGIDDTSAARGAAEHLISQGHGRLGVVASAISSTPPFGLADPRWQASATFGISRARLAGYRAAIEAAGLPWPDVPVYECPSSTKALGREAATELLSREPRPTALLAFSDQLALGAVEAAEELGLSVPADLSVVGFDDVPEAATATPPLTSVSQDHAEKGRLAGEMLIAQLRGDEPATPVLMPTRLVIRGSTAPPQ